jgi:hypothetical protein
MRGVARFKHQPHAQQQQHQGSDVAESYHTEMLRVPEGEQSGSRY